MNKLNPFKWFVLQNFPFIEADFDALTNYELMCKVVEYLNETIAKTNELGNQVEVLTNWFNNLDVQDEIDNKLDEMAEDGTLEEIIAEYLNTNALIIFETLADLKQAENLIAGSKVKTLGYNSVNDGGGSYYKVRNVLNTDTENDMDIIALQDENLVAEYIRENIINVKQFGAKGDNLHNDTENIQKAIDYAVTNKLEVFVPAGNYLIDHIEIYGGINFYGENKNLTNFYTTNNINYDNAINISGSYTQVSNFTLIGTSDGDYDSQAHVQNGISFGTTSENYAYRLNIHDIEVKYFTGSGIYRSGGIAGYLADSLFDNLFISYNEQYGCYLNGNSDFSIINSYFAQNRFTGLHFQCSNCRLLNNKYYLNGVGIYNGDDSTAQTRYHGAYIKSYGTIITNCSSQENYGDGYCVEDTTSSIISNCTSDANGILGFTEDSYDLQHHGSTRIARTSGTVTNAYAGFRFKNVSRTMAEGLNVLSFIDTDTYGFQMSHLYYFEGNISLNLKGYGVVSNTSTYNNTFDLGNNIIELNDTLLGNFANYFKNISTFTISDIVTGASTGSFKINIPNWANGICIVRLQKANSMIDILMIACSRTNNGVITAKISDQTNYTLTNTADGVTVNITSGGLYGATIKTL